jgi:hypothetical protein
VLHFGFWSGLVLRFAFFLTCRSGLCYVLRSFRLVGLVWCYVLHSFGLVGLVCVTFCILLDL